MKSNAKGITPHLYTETPRQPEVARHRVGTSFGIHPENTPALIGEAKYTDIDTVLICAEPAFHHGVQSGRCAFIALTFERREIVAQDVENALQWALYDISHPVLWRYGYACGWNEQFYHYAIRKREEYSMITTPTRYERRER